VRHDIARVDQLELERRYGVPRQDALDDMLIRLYTLTRRLAGLRLAGALVRPRLAFDGRADGKLQIVRRQLLRTRASMTAD
jgi:hypothetical protein